MEDKVITDEELSKHTKEADVWLSIHGKVYDVTSYLADHPGGMDVMLEHGGAVRGLCNAARALPARRLHGHQVAADARLRYWMCETVFQGRASCSTRRRYSEERGYVVRLCRETYDSR